MIIALKIFSVRILDVGLGTIRMILLVKERKVIASIVGFFEVAIWFAIVKEALNTTEAGLLITLAYAGGFAAGTFIGSLISNKFISGSFNIQIITNKNNEVINNLREHGYAVSVLDIRGKDETTPKYMLIMQINKKDYNKLEKLIKNLDSKAFIVVNETKFVLNGYFENVVK